MHMQQYQAHTSKAPSLAATMPHRPVPAPTSSTDLPLTMLGSPTSSLGSRGPML